MPLNEEILPVGILKRPIIIKGIIALLLLVFGVTSAPLHFIPPFMGLQSWQSKFLISRFLYWGCLAFAFYYCAKVEKQKLLLWAERRQTAAVYGLSMVVIYFILIYGGLLIYKVFTITGIKVRQVREKQMFALLHGQYCVILFASLTAGVVEELLFRGYLISRLAVITGSRWVGVIISSTLFGLYHFGYYSVYHIVITAFIGFVFAVHYLKYQNIKILIIFHFLWDELILLSHAR